MCVEKAISLGATSLHLSLDSELVVKQYSGEYAVKSTTLQSLHQRLLRGGSRLRALKLCHVVRELNTHADALANEALDEDPDVVASGSTSHDTAGCDSSHHRRLKLQAVSFLPRPSPTPPEELSHSSYPGTQYPSDDDFVNEPAQTGAGNGSSEGPRAPVRAGHGQWRRLRDVTMEWVGSKFLCCVILSFCGCAHYARFVLC